MISVVIPAYNEEKYIGATLESLARQTTKKEFEVIIVNNASTDKTASVARSFAPRIKNLHVIDEKQKGRGRARVTGFEAAKGDIVLCTDADSRVPEDWVERMSAPFTDKSIVGLSSAAQIDDFDAVRNWIYNIGDVMYMRSYRLFLGYNTIVGFSLAVRKDAYTKSGGFRADLKAQEDLEFGIRLHKQGTILFLPDLKVLVSGRRFKAGIFQGLFQYIQTTFEFFVLRRVGIDLDDVR